MYQRFLWLLAFGVVLVSPGAYAFGGSDASCLDSGSPVYSDVRFDVVDALGGGGVVKVRGVLSEPVRWSFHDRCFKLVENPAAVVILHGSGGIDARGTFYAQKLSERYATLSVEMFQGSIDGGGSNRPPLPIFNYTHAFGALNYLVDAEGFIDANGDIVASDGGGNLKRKVRVNPGAVGCLGFSWGGVICNQIATETYSQQHGDALYGTDYRFAAHVAHYPVCWARNVPGFPGLAFGSPDAPLTGRPLLIQIGSEDAYDNAEGDSGSEVCNQLKSSLVAEEQDLVEVRILEGGHHAFDRVFAPSAVVQDPFARLGKFLASPPEDYPEVPVIPDLGLANEALWNIQRLFFLHLR